MTRCDYFCIYFVLF